MQVLIAISGFCVFCSPIGNTPCTTPCDFLFVISLHVPAWGTTAFLYSTAARIGISIHVPAWGTTPSASITDELIKIFQSAFPRGERRRSTTMSRSNENFNPRSRVGNDAAEFFVRGGQTLFQSTFPRGERPLAPADSADGFIFQSTFPRGERPWPAWKLREQSTFQSTFPRGERPALEAENIDIIQFQSTFPRGERPEKQLSLAWISRFQSTFPRGERPSRTPTI